MRPVALDHLLELAIHHHQSGRHAEAESLYRQALALAPDNFDALHLLGTLASQAGRPDVAIDLIRRATRARPASAEARTSLGRALVASGYFEAAIDAFRRSLELNPDRATGHDDLADALAKAGRLEEAVAAHRAAIQMAPTTAHFHYNLGNALKASGRLEEAISAYREALRLEPALPQAHNNLGIALQESGQFSEALRCYSEATRLEPRSFMAWNNLGDALEAAGRIDEAIAACREALEWNPECGNAHNNLANCHREQGRTALALEGYRRAVSFDPSAADWHSNLVYTACFDANYEARDLLAESVEWSAQHAEPVRRSNATHANQPSPARRLRIGYVSPDFRAHVVGANLLPILQEHDRNQVETFCYSNVHQADAVTARIQAICDHWRNIKGVHDERAAELIRADRIDILVDLSLHMAHNRLLLFARKPAPVQVTYLGYCGTTGLQEIHYRLSDPYLDPTETDLACYSEETIRLSCSYWCYQPLGPAPEITPLPASTGAGVTFGCLNNLAKVSPRALELWMDILEAVPQSRLLLHAPDGSCREEICEGFVSHGLSPDRVQFVGRQPWKAYVHGVGRMDVALDPFPYAGGITTLDALWMGVPVVTLSGRTSVGRSGCSILSNLGLPELIAQTPEQYFEIALSLANDLPRLGKLRSTLRERMERSPLRDARGLARDIEGAYRAMWRRWCG